MLTVKEALDSQIAELLRHHRSYEILDALWEQCQTVDCFGDNVFWMLSWCKDKAPLLRTTSTNSLVQAEIDRRDADDRKGDEE